MKEVLISFTVIVVPVSLVGAGVDIYIGQPTIGGEEYLIAGWSFNDVTGSPGDHLAVSHGIGGMSTNWEAENMIDFAGTTVNRFGADLAGRDLGLRNGPDSLNEGRHVEFALELHDFEGLVVTYATRRSGTGFTDQEWWWSLDGETFTHFTTVAAGDSYVVRTIDFSSVKPMNGADEVFLRLILSGLPDSPAAAGNNRFDNFQFRATASLGTAAPGEAVLSNATVGSSYEGRPVFLPGEIQSLEVTITGAEGSVIESVSVSLPEVWHGVSPSEIDLTGVGFSDAFVEIFGGSVVVSGASINEAAKGKVILHGLHFPSAEVAGEYGRFSVSVATAISGAEFGMIGRKPEGMVVIPVSRIRSVDEDGIALSIGQRVAVSGVATVSSGVFHNTRFITYLQDETAGVAVDHPSLSDMWSGSVEGDRYTVVGRVGQFEGLTRIELDGREDLILLGPGAVPEPKVRTIEQLLAEAEVLEGSLVRIVRGAPVDFSDDWPSPGENGTLTFSDDGGAHDLQVFLSRFTDISWLPEPEYPADLVGIFSQRKTVAPYTSGYQLLPRSAVDFLPASEVQGGFEEWRRAFFADQLEQLHVSGPLGDPDGDGVCNLMEYAIGGDPLSDSRSLLPAVNLVDDHLEITFRRGRDATDLIYAVEASPDLEEWNEIWSSENFLYPSSESFVEETVLDEKPLSEAVNRFLRLVVTRAVDEI